MPYIILRRTNERFLGTKFNIIEIILNTAASPLLSFTTGFYSFVAAGIEMALD
jgi:hypothetical protein